MDAGADVANSEGGEDRRAIGITTHVQHAGVCGAHGVVARAVRQWPPLAEAGNRAHYDFWIQQTYAVVSESHSRDNAGCVILNQYVYIWDQGLDNLQTRGIFHVDAEAFLASILLYVISTAAVAQKRQCTARIAAWRKLDLNNLGSHLGHHPRCGRPGQDLSEI